MNMQELKGKLFASVNKWADTRIDEMVKGCPNLAIPSIYMKRAVHNIIAKNKEDWMAKIDSASLFLADENGNIDADTIFDDIIQMLACMEKQKYDFGIIHGTVGEGAVSIDLPDNIFTVLLFGSKRCISILPDDLTELKSLIH